jgi:methyl-accepting chemotaxis protein
MKHREARRIRDMKRRSRRRWFPVVNRSLQFKFLAIILAYGGLTILVLGAALFLPDFFHLADETLDFQAKMRASEIIVAIHQRLWIPVILLLTFVGGHFFRIFHRVVGPLYRFRWAFGEIAKGNLALTVRIRQDDFLQLEEAALNDMINAVSEKLESVQKATDAALASLDRFERLLPPDPEAPIGPEIRQSLGEHRQALKAVREEMRGFKLD